jgi:hypothetical protein
MKNLPKTNLV